VRLEGRCSVTPALAAPLIAGALLGACASEAQSQGNATALAAAEVKPSPTEVAQRLVRQRLGTSEARFSAAQVFDSEGATIVCGRVAQGSGEQRYIAIGEEDLFIEGEMEPGHMDRAAQEFCRNA
jgi:hypothetical protein